MGNFKRNMKRNYAKGLGLPANWFMASQIRKRKAIEEAKTAYLRELQEEVSRLNKELEEADNDVIE